MRKIISFLMLFCFVVGTVWAQTSPITDVSELDNTAIYTVSTVDRGAWIYSSDQNALTSTTKLGTTVDAEDENQQFAFLTVNGATYLYSVGAGKFIVKSEGYTSTSDSPTETVSLLATTNTSAPVVVALSGQYQMGVSNGYSPAVITFWNDLNDGGNQAIITAVGETDFSTVLATITEAQLPQAKEALNETINKAQEWSAVDFLAEATKTALADGITQATAVLNAEDATFTTVTDANTQLTAGIAAIAGTEVGGFSNNAVYTFISKRSDTAYMMYDGTNDFVASPWMQTTLEAGADNVNCQWAVYQSAKGNYYLYNIGAGKFMGKETAANTGIPFTATPATTDLKLKISGVASHPIMISSDNGGGAVNQSNNTGFTNNFGVVNWSGGWGYTDDLGNIHAVVKVADIDETVLATIEAAVTAFEDPQSVAIRTLEEAIAAAQTKVNSIGTAIGYYTCSNANAASDLEEIEAWLEAITDDTTVEEIETKTAEANAITNATYTVILPETGKFYRFKHPTENAYMLSDVYTDNTSRLAMGTSQVSSIFYYGEDGTLLSYDKGQYLPKAAMYGNWTCLAVGTVGPAATFGAGSVVGCVGFYLGDDASRSFYSARKTYVDAGGTFGTNSGYDWIVEEVTWLPVAMNTTAGYATLNSPVALSTYAWGTTDANRVMAYTGVIEDDYLTLTRIDAEDGIIPANTPVVLEYVQDEEDGYVFLQVVDSEKAAVTSSLSGTVAAATCEADANYSLAYVNDEIGFYSYAGTTLKGFKAFLPKSTTSATNALRIRKGETTAIENVQTETENGAIYDLSGRRVQKMVKGLYIVNGKKMIKK